MGVYDRLVGTEEPKLAVHQFSAIWGEYKRAAPGIDVSFIVESFSLSNDEKDELLLLQSQFDNDLVNEALLHGVLLLGELGVYDVPTVKDRLGVNV